MLCHKIAVLARDIYITIMGLVIPCNRGNAVRNNFVIEGIRQQCPFPLLSHAFQNGHARYNELKRGFCIPLNELMKKKTA